MERLPGTAAPNVASPPAGATGSPAQAAAAAHGTSTGRWQSLMAWAHRLRGWGFLPRPWSPSTECLQEMAAPNGGGALAERKGIPALAAAGAYGAAMGDDCPQRRGPNG